MAHCCCRECGKLYFGQPSLCYDCEQKAEADGKPKRPLSAAEFLLVLPVFLLACAWVAVWLVFGGLIGKLAGKLGY